MQDRFSTIGRVEGTDINQSRRSALESSFSACLLVDARVASLVARLRHCQYSTVLLLCANCCAVLRSLLARGLVVFSLFLTSAFADQSDPQLGQLFDQLRQAQSPAAAQSVESEIWQTWLVAPDADSDRLLRATVDALGQRDFREALIISSELVQDYPDYAEGWNKRATIHYLMGNFDSSVIDIGETLRLEPRHFGAISGLGLIFQAQGNLEASLDAFEQVLEISPQSLNAQRSVQHIKQQLGREI